MSKPIQGKEELQKIDENRYIEVMDQSGVEKALSKFIDNNKSLIPQFASMERIINAASFYIVNKPELMNMDKKNKLLMIYGVLNEAMLGNEAGGDYDILLFKGEPTISRNKDGWFKIIDLIKPADILRFTLGAPLKEDYVNFDPVTEDLTHRISEEQSKISYDNIQGGYAHIEFANGFKKTIYMNKAQIDLIKSFSPGANGDKKEFTVWYKNPQKMVKTKAAKELAKELVTLFKGRLTSQMANAINSDELVVQRIDGKGNIITDNSIYNQEELIIQDDVIVETLPKEESKEPTKKITDAEVNINDL